MAQVVFTANLRRHVDCSQIEVAGSCVAQALEAAFSLAPRVRDYVLDEQGQLRKHVVIYVDGRRIVDRAALSDAVRPDSEVWVLQALSGG